MKAGARRLQSEDGGWRRSLVLGMDRGQEQHGELRPQQFRPDFLQNKNQQENQVIRTFEHSNTVTVQHSGEAIQNFLHQSKWEESLQ